MARAARQRGCQSCPPLCRLPARSRDRVCRRTPSQSDPAVVRHGEVPQRRPIRRGARRERLHPRRLARLRQLGDEGAGPLSRAGDRGAQHRLRPGLRDAGDIDPIGRIPRRRTEIDSVGIAPASHAITPSGSIFRDQPRDVVTSGRPFASATAATIRTKTLPSSSSTGVRVVDQRGGAVVHTPRLARVGDARLRERRGAPQAGRINANASANGSRKSGSCRRLCTWHARTDRARREAVSGGRWAARRTR